jgi:hypothetical protein
MLFTLLSKQSQQHTGNKSLGASKVNSILEISLWEQAKPTAYWKLVFESKQSQQFPVCCLLCLLPKIYFQYAVGFACSQRLISSMLLALLAPTGNKSLRASKANSILEISLWEQAK